MQLLGKSYFGGKGCQIKMWQSFIIIIIILNIVCYVLYRSEKIKGLCNEKLKGTERLTPPPS